MKAKKSSSETGASRGRKAGPRPGTGRISASRAAPSKQRRRARVPRESAEARRVRAGRIVALLAEEYREARCALDHRSAFELIVATILSAQCTDVRVNMVTPALFRRWPDAQALASAAQGEVERVIHSTGFFRNKAKNLIGMAQALVAHHGGEVPDAMESLVALPGVARKTANVVLGTWFGRNEGVVVDTHVARIATRLGLTREADPAKIEADLMGLLPRPEWTMFSHRVILHGRRICDARKPKCAACSLRESCPSRQDAAAAGGATRARRTGAGGVSGAEGGG